MSGNGPKRDARGQRNTHRQKPNHAVHVIESHGVPQSGVHVLRRVTRRRIFYHRNLVPELSGKAYGGLHARMDSFTHKVANPAWKSKPSGYTVATIDRSINPDQERMMAKRARAKTVEVTASHVAYMSDPKETALLIEEAAISGTSTSSR